MVCTRKTEQGFNGQAKKNTSPGYLDYQYERGVGKTTISAHLFREFYLKTEKSVLVIDFDPQFNLTQAIISEAQYERHKKANRTILSIMESQEEVSLYSTHENGHPVPEIDDVVVNQKYLYKGTRDNIVAKLDVVPGDFSLSKFSLMDNKGLTDLAANRFIEFIEKARERYDLVCLDCNPSSSFLTVCALKASTHLLVPVRPDRYSMLGLRMLDNFVNGFNGIAVKPKKIIVLNGIPTTKYDPAVENELRADPVYGPITLTTSLYMTKLLEANPRYTGFATDRKVPHSASLKKRVSSLATELATALGMK